jgi:hypothetical protein
MKSKFKASYNPTYTGDRWPWSIVPTTASRGVSYPSRRGARRAAIVENLRLTKNKKRFMNAGQWIKISEFITVP